MYLACYCGGSGEGENLIMDLIRWTPPETDIQHPRDMSTTTILSYINRDCINRFLSQTQSLRYYTIILLLPCDIRNYSPEKKLFPEAPAEGNNFFRG